MLCRILKTRIKHRYFTRGKSFESGTSLAWQRRVHMNCDTRRRNHVHFFWKGENSKREQDEKDE